MNQEFDSEKRHSDYLVNQEFDSEKRHSDYLVNQDLLVKKDT